MASSLASDPEFANNTFDIGTGAIRLSLSARFGRAWDGIGQDRIIWGSDHSQP